MAASINRKSPWIIRGVFSTQSEMDLFATIIDSIQSLTIFEKHSISSFSQDYKCASSKFKQKHGGLSFISQKKLEP